MSFPAPEHEGRQEPGLNDSWCEAFSFEFFSDGPPAGFLTLVLRPNLGQAWLWAGGVTGRDQVTLAELDLEVPEALTHGAEGLEVELTCEQPLRLWTARLESPSLAMRLRFETSQEVPGGGPQPPRYAFGGTVRGELRVRAEQATVDGWGVRGHLWADVDWSQLGTRVIGHSDSGGWLLVGGPNREALDIQLEPVASTRVPAAAPDGSPLLLRREFGRLRTPDGRTGWGWLAGLDDTVL